MYGACASLCLVVQARIAVALRLQRSRAETASAFGGSSPGSDPGREGAGGDAGDGAASSAALRRAKSLKGGAMNNKVRGAGSVQGVEDDDDFLESLAMGV